MVHHSAIPRWLQTSLGQVLFLFVVQFLQFLQFLLFKIFFSFINFFYILSRRCPAFRREQCVTHKINSPDEFAKTVRPAVSPISLFLLLLRLMLCRAVMWVLNLVESRCRRCKRTGEETNTNNKPYPALKCPSSPWMSAVPSFHVFTTHTPQSIPNPQMLPLHRPSDLL